MNRRSEVMDIDDVFPPPQRLTPERQERIRSVLLDEISPAVAPGRPRHTHRHWRVPAAAAAVALAVAGVAVLGTGPHTAGHGLRPGPSSEPPATSSPANTQQPAQGSLTAMRVVAPSATLKAVGALNGDDNFLTCVGSSVCYVLGTTDGGREAAIARSVNGGATWTAGQGLPNSRAAEGFNAAVACPKPLTCFSPYGTGMLETTDGFAHYRIVPISLPPGSQLGQISCPTMRLCVGSAWLGGHRQTFVYSDDGGLSWAQTSSPSFSGDDIVAGLRCDADGACIAALLLGNAANSLVGAMTSVDGGHSWVMSRTYSMGNMEQYMVSCGDGQDCLVSSNNSVLAWLHAARGDHVSARVQSNWSGGPAAAISCATGSVCYAVSGAAIEATRDGGRTWSQASLAPSLPMDEAAYLSCPVAAGCVALANDANLNGYTWVVLSNL
jgi:predicted regulator of Ras-like GTPase activity (Roadblock/LC7/MglB family)